MKDFLLATEKICSYLKEEYNEVIYRAWLFFIEEAKFKNNNIIITVPNQYIKETFEERYIIDIENLFKAEMNFSKLIVTSALQDNLIPQTPSILESLEEPNNLNAIKDIMLTSKNFSVSL